MSLKKKKAEVSDLCLTTNSAGAFADELTQAWLKAHDGKHLERASFCSQEIGRLTDLLRCFSYAMEAVFSEFHSELTPKMRSVGDQQSTPGGVRITWIQCPNF